MRTLGHILGPVLLGVVVWAIVSYNANRVLGDLGIQGGYSVRAGNLGSLVLGFYLFLGFCAATILNGVMGYCLAEAANSRHKITLVAVAVLLIFIVPLVANYGIYIADNRS